MLTSNKLDATASAAVFHSFSSISQVKTICFLYILVECKRLAIDDRKTDRQTVIKKRKRERKRPSQHK